jgi:hypothetical protein
MRTLTRLLAALLVALVIATAGLHAITATRVTVATTATLVYTSATGGSTVLVRNPGTVSVYLGAADVTTATGFELGAGDNIALPLGGTDPVYGIVAAATNVVHVLESRR